MYIHTHTDIYRYIIYTRIYKYEIIYPYIDDYTYKKLINTHTNICIYIYIYIIIYIHKCIYTYIYIHIYTHTYIYTHIFTYIIFIHTHTYIYINMYMHIYICPRSPHPPPPKWYGPPLPPKTSEPRICKLFAACGRQPPICTLLAAFESHHLIAGPCVALYV